MSSARPAVLLAGMGDRLSQNWGREEVKHRWLGRKKPLGGTNQPLVKAEEI